jgi:lipoprotein-anchoring transpeptidase ErfK/SrfK
MQGDFIRVEIKHQHLIYYNNHSVKKIYSISTAKKGLGEASGSHCTPRGWHSIHSIIGQDNHINDVFVGRQWTGEQYSPKLAEQFPHRDWILTRILQLDGLEPGLNQGGTVDSLNRYIYIHGTPDTTPLGVPGSHGCIRMRNTDIVELANWVRVGMRINIS